jgi:SAM-dependent methyltransferase
MASDTRPCTFCGAASVYALTASDRNRETTSERFTYNRCTACGTVFMVDVPADLSRYYLGDYHGFRPDGVPEWQHNPTLREVEAFRVRLLRRHVEPGALVDVGAGPGGFAAAATDAGFEVTAIEMDARCCEYLENELGVRAIRSEEPIAQLRTLPPARVISLWHSLEHLRDPAEMLAVAAERLEPGGVLAIGVPNPRSLQFRLLGARWAHLDAPRHVCLIPEDALVSHLRSLGLRPLEATTGDPFGRVCSLHGWAYALRRRPARGETPPEVMRLAQAITIALGPIEHWRRRGAVLTLLLGKDRVRRSPRAPAGRSAGAPAPRDARA